jgi:hypothetical protein
MEAFFKGPQAVDLLIAVFVIEAACLVLQVALGRSWGALASMAPTWLSGMGLLLAWRAAVSDMPWFVAALALLAAGAAHVWDLWRRWPRAAT